MLLKNSFFSIPLEYTVLARAGRAAMQCVMPFFISIHGLST